MKELKQSGLYSSEKKRALALEEENLLINYLSTNSQYKRWYPVIITMLKTGLRVGEATGLTWDDIDFDKNEITVSKTLVFYCHHEEHRNQYSINTPKTKAGIRKVPMLQIVKTLFFSKNNIKRI